jgi:hypothetical protein
MKYFPVIPSTLRALARSIAVENRVDQRRAFRVAFRNPFYNTIVLGEFKDNGLRADRGGDADVPGACQRHVISFHALPTLIEAGATCGDQGGRTTWRRLRAPCCARWFHVARTRIVLLRSGRCEDQAHVQADTARGPGQR